MSAEKLFNPPRNIAAMADVVEDQQIRRDYTEEELAEFKSTLSAEHIRLEILNEELAEIKEEYKPKISGCKKLINKSAKALRAGYEIVEVKAYGIANHDTGYMEFVTEFGDKVSSRRLYPNERQLSIHSNR
jgi:phage host-nuclease inhibitor protein Gam